MYGHVLTLARLPRAVRDARELKGGERLELGRAPDGSADWGLEVHHTPGHDRGHLVFIEDRYRAALVGDLLSTLSTIVIDPPEGHMATYLDSLRRMTELELGVIYPAHGPAVKDGTRRFQAYLEHRRAREKKLVRALESGLSEREELLAVVYDDAPEPLRPVARRSLLAGLEKLVEDGRALEDGERWRIA